MSNIPCADKQAVCLSDIVKKPEYTNKRLQESYFETAYFIKFEIQVGITRLCFLRSFMVGYVLLLARKTAIHDVNKIENYLYKEA